MLITGTLIGKRVAEKVIQDRAFIGICTSEKVKINVVNQ